MKKVLSLIVAVSLVLSLGLVCFANESVDSNNKNHTIKEYEEFLVNQPGGYEALEQFRKLPKKEQQKIVNAVYDPYFVEAMIHALVNESNKNTYSLSNESDRNTYSDYITITSEKSIDPRFSEKTITGKKNIISPMSTKGNKVIGKYIKDTETVSIGGFKIWQLYGELTYDYIHGEEISRVQAGDIAVTINYVPFATYDCGRTSLTHTSCLAKASCTITCGAGFDQLDLDVGGVTAKIRGSWTGHNYGVTWSYIK